MSELDEVSSSWKRARLDEACEVILGQSPPGSSYNFDGEGLPFFQGKAEFGDYYPTPVKWCSAPTKIAEAEDVLISVRAPVGPTNLCPMKACIGRGLAAIRPKNGIPSRYILYALRATVRALVDQATGTTFEAVSGSDLRAHEIALAPADEQPRIVSEIEKQFTRLEAGVAALRRVQANLKRYRASVLKAACEGRLVPTEAEWKQIPLKELIGRIAQGWSPKCDLTRDALPDEWAVVTTTAVQSMRYIDNQAKPLPSTFEPRPHIEIMAGDFLMTRKGPRKRAGVACLVRSTRARIMVCDTVYRFRCHESRVVPGYLELALNSPSVTETIDRQKAGINESGVSLTHDKLGGVLIPLPPMAEQMRIVAEVERRLSVVAELESVVSANLQRAVRLRQCILNGSFSETLINKGTK